MALFEPEQVYSMTRGHDDGGESALNFLKMRIREAE